MNAGTNLGDRNLSNSTIRNQNLSGTSWQNAGTRPQNAQQVQSFLSGQPRTTAQGNLSQLNSELSQLNQNAQQLSSRSEQLTAKAENFDTSNLQSSLEQASSNVQSAVNDWQSGPDPFSPAWYAEHPNAWQATHPYANEVAVATVASVAAWTAYTAYPSGSSTVVTTGDTYIYEAAPASEEAPPAEPQPAAADPVDATEWLPLGTFEVAPAADSPTTRVIQLAVSRQATVRGVYYDQLTGTTQNLSGQLDQKTQQVTWHADDNPQVKFAASLQDLTSDTGTVTISQGGGDFEWSLRRQQ